MHQASKYWKQASVLWVALLLSLIFCSGCGSQVQQSDPRLRYFVVIDVRILIEGNQAQVIGEVVNHGTAHFPFDVTMQATLTDMQGNVIGGAGGTAEDVGPGQVRQFLLIGTVDGTRYARMKVVPISLQEKRQELNMPTPTPIGS